MPKQSFKYKPKKPDDFLRLLFRRFAENVLANIISLAVLYISVTKL